MYYKANYLANNIQMKEARRMFCLVRKQKKTQV
jgi:hypothetical protein